MKRIILAAALALAVTLPAQAQNGSLTRSFVSSSGVDGNPCTIAQPCATFARAYTMVGANGIIAALDPGKYGPLTGTSAITSGVTINGNGWAAITAPPAGVGITVNANSGENVTLKGLEIDGAGAAYNGIVFNSGSSLTIADCDIENISYNGGAVHTGNGILIQPSGGLTFSVTNTTLANNGANGLLYNAVAGVTVNGTIDHVKATSNTGSGIQIFMYYQTAGEVTVAISSSLLSNNQGDGIGINFSHYTAQGYITLDNLTVTGNQTKGIHADGANPQSFLLLSRSVVQGPASQGIDNQMTSTTHFFSFGDNYIDSGTDGLTTTPRH
jgi:hypothetical protein